MLKPPSDKISAETREKLLALADYIEADQTRGFYMGLWFIEPGSLFYHKRLESDRPECGTACCMGGYWDVMPKSDSDLGLTPQQRYELFFPKNGYITSNDRAKAVRVLRHFAYTGDVDWSV